ncbi:hypothetical protein ACTXT7_016845, partial [Hymenolepis weldensis]
EYETKRSREEGKERKHHPKLVPDLTTELKPESKVNSVKRTENGDLRVMSKVNSVFRSRHTEGKPGPKEEIRTGPTKVEGGGGGGDAESCSLELPDNYSSNS